MPVTAQQVELQVRNRNITAADIPPLPPGMNATGDPVRIFNVGPYRHVVDSAYGTITIHACEPGHSHSKATDIPRFPNYTVPVDMKKVIRQFEPGGGVEVARDIIGIGAFKSEANSLEHQGVFIAAGQEPTQAELDAANAKFRAYDFKQIEEANDFWRSGPLAIGNITRNHRDALARRNQTADWAQAQIEYINCPGCGSKLLPGVARHMPAAVCGWVLDWDKARAGGMISAEEYANRPGAAPRPVPAANGPIPGQPMRQAQK